MLVEKDCFFNLKQEELQPLQLLKIVKIERMRKLKYHETRKSQKRVVDEV